MLEDILPRGPRESEEPRRGLSEGALRTHSQSQGSAQREEVGVKGDARAAPSHELNKPENELKESRARTVKEYRENEKEEAAAAGVTIQELRRRKAERREAMTSTPGVPREPSPGEVPKITS